MGEQVEFGPLAGGLFFGEAEGLGDFFDGAAGFEGVDELLLLVGKFAPVGAPLGGGEP